MPYVTNNARPPPTTRRAIAVRRLARPSRALMSPVRAGTARTATKVTGIRHADGDEFAAHDLLAGRVLDVDHGRERHGRRKRGPPRTGETFPVNAQFNLEVGRERVAPGEFFGHSARRWPRQPLPRYKATSSASSCRWQQAFSPDGGVSWETNWVMDFQRVR